MNHVAEALGRIRLFAEVVEAEGLHGLAFQHLALCRRRAWLHLNRIDYAHLDTRMQRGLALHDASRPRDSSVEGLIGLTPDRIEWKNRCVHEAKGGAGAKDAVARQAVFYALMLWAAQGEPWAAVTDILPAKRQRAVPITTTLIDEMVVAAAELKELRHAPHAPTAVFTPFCASCSYRYLCGAG